MFESLVFKDKAKLCRASCVAAHELKRVFVYLSCLVSLSCFCLTEPNQVVGLQIKSGASL